MAVRKIFKKSLADKLMANGHTLIRTDRNPHNDKYLLFIFQSTPEFEQDMTKFAKQK